MSIAGFFIWMWFFVIVGGVLLSGSNNPFVAIDKWRRERALDKLESKKRAEADAKRAVPLAQYNTLPTSLKELCDMHEAVPVENRFPNFFDLMLEFKKNGVTYGSYEYRTVQRELGAINAVVANQKEALKRAGIGTEALEAFKMHALQEKEIIVSTTNRINELHS